MWGGLAAFLLAGIGSAAAIGAARVALRAGAAQR